MHRDIISNSNNCYNSYKHRHISSSYKIIIIISIFYGTLTPCEATLSLNMYLYIGCKSMGICKTGVTERNVCGSGCGVGMQMMQMCVFLLSGHLCLMLTYIVSKAACKKLLTKNQTLSSQCWFSVAGLDHTKFGFYQFQSFLSIVIIVISILHKTTFSQISIHSQLLVKILQRSDKEKKHF